MTTLVLLWPERAAGMQPTGAEGVPPAGSDSPQPHVGSEPIAYVLSNDGTSVADHGRVTPPELPRADTVIAVLPAQAVSWHRLTLPKAPGGRMRAALAGLLEEHLLDDDTHLALAPDARAGEPCWVAALRKAQVAAQLGAWASAGIQPDRLVAALTPGAAACAHVQGQGAATDAPLSISLADDTMACALPLDGGLARARMADFQARHGSGLRVTATPAAAAAAERWLGQPVVVRGEAEQTLLAARTGWELRQFDLAPSLRGTRMLGRLARRLTGPDWRWARWGLAAAIVVQLIGLNVTAWRLERAIDERKQAQVDLLRAAHPQVRAVLDAPLQMRRETERLRAAAGIAGEADMEALMALAGRAWPPDAPPTPMLRYEPGRLTLSAPGWQPAQMTGFSERLRSDGGRAEFANNQVVVSKAETEAATTPPPAPAPAVRGAAPGTGAPPPVIGAPPPVIGAPPPGTATPPGMARPPTPRGPEAS